jgi:hypothetical protein
MIESQGEEIVAASKAAMEENKRLAEEYKKASPKRKKDIEARYEELRPLIKIAGELKTGQKKGGKQTYYEMFEKFKREAGGDPEKAAELLAKKLKEDKAITTRVAPIGGPVPVAPGATPAAVAPTVTAPTPAAARVTEAAKNAPTVDGQTDTTKAIEKTNKRLKDSALGKPPGAYKTLVTDSTLEAIRKGLFEYYMYSQMKPVDVIKAVKGGADTELLARRAVEKGSSEAGLTDILTEQAKKTTPKAGGGLVTSIVNGRANVSRLPPGEGWTPIGRGERILPAGAGGGGGTTKVELEFKGDFRRFVNARVVEGSAEFQRNRRLR